MNNNYYQLLLLIINNKLNYNKSALSYLSFVVSLTKHQVIHLRNIVQVVQYHRLLPIKQLLPSFHTGLPRMLQPFLAPILSTVYTLLLLSFLEVAFLTQLLLILILLILLLLMSLLVLLLFLNSGFWLGLWQWFIFGR